VTSNDLEALIEERITIMNLFEVLPQNLFSILVSKNKHIYVDALFILRKAFKQEMSILKRDLITMARDRIWNRVF